MEGKTSGKKRTGFLLLGIVALVVAAGVGVGLALSKENEPFVNDIKPVRQYQYSDVVVETAKEDKHILDAAVIGLWVDARLDGGSFGPGRSYDNKKASRWNPCACANYVGDPAIVYLLDGYYDMDGWEMLFTAREYFFNLYTSKDGKEFKLVKEVTKENFGEVYTLDGDRFVCTLQNLDAKDIVFVKVMFTGSNSENNSAWVSLNSVRCIGKRLGDGPEELPEFDDPYKIEPMEVERYKLIGTWLKDQTGTSDVAPEKTYDGNIYSPWNPGAKPRFEEEPGIVYTLSNAKSIKKIQLYFGKYRHYFDLFVSQDGRAFSQVAKISFANEDQAYTIDKNKAYICTLDGLSLQNIKYIKIVFTGREDGGNWVLLNEVILYEMGATGVDTSWMLRAEPVSKHPWIESSKIVGNWKDTREKQIQWSRYKSYDEDLSTFWNPEATAKYAGEPGVVYTLKKAMALNRLQLTFGKDIHYFDVYTSPDGKDYAKIASISPANSNEAYENGEDDTYICTLDGLTLKNVKSIKLIFTGRKSGSTWVALQEIDVAETGATGVDISWMLRTEPVSKHPWIESATLVGLWQNDRKGDAAWGVAQSYDEKLNTFWNPAAAAKYVGEPGVVYTLKKAMALNKLQLFFKNDIFYFDIYTSTDGENYIKNAVVSPENEGKAYTSTENGGWVCTLEGLELKDIAAIKILFTGRKANNAWVSLQEIVVSETGATGADTSWMLPGEPGGNEEQTSSDRAVIESATTVGSWVTTQENTSHSPLQSYDEDQTTFWNPGANPAYKGEPGIVYTLKDRYDITALKFIFAIRYFYFNVAVSEDGTVYTPIASVDATNYTSYYGDGYICSIENLTARDVKYIKVLFTGDSQNKCWVSFNEFEAKGTVSMEQDDPETEKMARITAGAMSGAWTTYNTEKISNAYDGDRSTSWDPAAKTSEFNAEESIVYTLDRTYSLTQIKLTSRLKQIWVDIYTSTDGKTWPSEPVCSVRRENRDSFYKNDGDYRVCTFSDLNGVKAGYVKIHFKGTNTDTATFSLCEVDIMGKTESGAAEENMTAAVIAKAEIVGTWVTDNSAGLYKAYDGNTLTMWNPNATAKYASGEGVVFTLDQIYDPLDEVVLTFGVRHHYFDLLVSSDGKTYETVCSITEDNASGFYTDDDANKIYVCKLSKLNAFSAQYVKLLFTGDAENKAWVALKNIVISGKKTNTMTQDTRATILSATPLGTWKLDRIGSASVGPEKAYDNDAAGTCWNPQTVDTTYTSGEGIEFMLDRTYDLTKVSLVFNRKHYFQLAVSEDGTNYTLIETVNQENMVGLYTVASTNPARVRCQLDISAKGVRYVKILFAGNEANNDFVGLFDVAILASVA